LQQRSSRDRCGGGIPAHRILEFRGCGPDLFLLGHVPGLGGYTAGADLQCQPPSDLCRAGGVAVEPALGRAARLLVSVGGLTDAEGRVCLCPAAPSAASQTEAVRGAGALNQANAKANLIASARWATPAAPTSEPSVCETALRGGKNLINNCKRYIISSRRIGACDVRIARGARVADALAVGQTAVFSCRNGASTQ